MNKESYIKYMKTQAVIVPNEKTKEIAKKLRMGFSDFSTSEKIKRRLK